MQPPRSRHLPKKASGSNSPRQVSAEENWDRAIDNFTQYLPPGITRWLVALELPVHRTMRRRLLPKLGSTQLFVLGQTSPALVQKAGLALRTDPSVGFLEFAVHDGRADHQGVDYQTALMTYARWPTSRLRICFDVWDDTFPVLFSETPADVKLRCQRTRYTVASAEMLTYRSRPESAAELMIDCANSRWVEYSGLEDYDYMLPSGEVACRPRSVDGVLDLDGWLIGTLPFGLKYGRIRPGELQLTFNNGRLDEVEGARRELVADLRAVITAVPALRTVIETGLGQSMAVPAAVPLCQPGYQWHERHYGLHLGLGAELPETLGRKRRPTNHHLDIVLASGRLDLDGHHWRRW